MKGRDKMEKIFPSPENINVCGCFSIFFFFLISFEFFFFNRSKYHRFERNCYFEISIRNTGRNEIGKNLKFVVLFGFSKNRQNSWIDNISRRVKYASVI